MSDGQAAQSTGGELASRIEAEEEDWADFEFRFGWYMAMLMALAFTVSPVPGWAVATAAVGSAGKRRVERCCLPGVLVRVESLGLLPGPARSMDFGVAVASRHAPPFISHAFFFFFICLPHVLYGIALVPEATLNVVG